MTEMGDDFGENVWGRDAILCVVLGGSRIAAEASRPQ